jgi:hypothetical protein
MIDLDKYYNNNNNNNNNNRLVFVFYLMTREKLVFLFQRLSVCVQRFYRVILQKSFVVDYCGVG